MIISTGLVLSLQLLVRPVLGLADNGDFQRVMEPLGITYPAGQDPGYWKYITVHYVIVPPSEVEFPSSEMLLVATARLLDHVLGADGIFDLRMLGAVHIGLLLCGLWLSLLTVQPFSNAARLAMGVTFPLVFTDIGYSAFFNSFYSEPASLLFFIILFCAAILVCLDTRRIWWLTVFAVGSMLFLTAKPQNVVSGPFLAMFPLYLMKRWSDRVLRVGAAASAAVILVAAFSYYSVTPPRIQAWTKHVSVLWELLGNSEDPAADLHALDLPAGLARYAGTHPWSPGVPAFDDSGFRSEFSDRLSLARVGIFYLERPSRLLATLDRSAERALLSRPLLGNNERHIHDGPGGEWISQSWSAVSRLRERFAPASLTALTTALAGLGGMVVMIFLRASRPLAVFLSLVLMSAVTQFVCVAVTQGSIDTIKHMFMFRFTVDMLLIVTLIAAIEALMTRTRRGKLLSWRQSP